MSKPKVDDTCIGCGTCEAICPAVFKLEEVGDAYLAVVQEADYQAESDAIDEAIDACPVKAISRP